MGRCGEKVDVGAWWPSLLHFDRAGAAAGLTGCVEEGQGGGGLVPDLSALTPTPHMSHTFPTQYELLGWFWVISVAELLIVLIFLGHLTGCFFYMFGGSTWWRTPEEQVLIAQGAMSTWVSVLGVGEVCWGGARVQHGEGERGGREKAAFSGAPTKCSQVLIAQGAMWTWVTQVLGFSQGSGWESGLGRRDVLGGAPLCGGGRVWREVGGHLVAHP